MDGRAVAVGEILDDALVDGPGGDLAKERLAQVVGVAGVLGVVKGDFEQDAGDGGEFAQFAKVGALSGRD